MPWPDLFSAASKMCGFVAPTGGYRHDLACLVVFGGAVSGTVALKLNRPQRLGRACQRYPSAPRKTDARKLQLWLDQQFHMPRLWAQRPPLKTKT
jgi:hypothetical protein